MTYWRVTFGADGGITAAEPVAAQPGADRCVIVWAKDEASARRKAFKVFCIRYAAEREMALRAEGRCQCGRQLDPQGGRRCAFCTHRPSRFLREDDQPDPTPRPAADRLETLLEVQRAWLDARNVGTFSAWLTAQIHAARAARVQVQVQVQARGAA